MNDEPVYEEFSSMLGHPVGVPVFNPAGFADAVEEFIEDLRRGTYVPYSEWDEDRQAWFDQDELEDYFDLAYFTHHEGDGLVPCCSGLCSHWQ